MRIPALPAFAALAGLLALAATRAQAQRQIVVYTCTDAFGHVSLQNGKPCAKGSRQQKQVIDAPAPAPAVVAPIAPPTVAPSVPSAAAANAPDATPETAAAPDPADLLPPPPL